MNVLLLLDDGWEATLVAEAFFLDVCTVEEYRQLYKATGASGVAALGYKGHPFSHMTSKELFVLKAHMAEQMSNLASRMRLCGKTSVIFTRLMQ